MSETDIGANPIVARVRQKLEEGEKMTQNLALLNAPFSKDVIEQKNAGGGKSFDYIPTAFVVERLNKALGVDGWSYEIRETQVVKELGTVLVLGRLVAGIGGNTVVKEQWGGQIINCKQNGDVIEITNDYKGAASDALKKCASLLGVGEELYMNGHKAPPQEQGQKAAGQQAAGQNGSPNTGSQTVTGNPASEKQVGLILDERKRRQDAWPAIYKILVAHGMPSIEGKTPEEALAIATEYLHKLTSKEASDLITALKALPFRSQQSAG